MKRIDTPAREPSDDTLLTPIERASIDVRLAATSSAHADVPEAQALAEVRLAYRLVRRARAETSTR